MSKRIIALLVAVILALTAIAFCEGTESESAPADQSAPATPAATKAPEAPKAPASESEKAPASESEKTPASEPDKAPAADADKAPAADTDKAPADTAPEATDASEGDAALAVTAAPEATDTEAVATPAPVTAPEITPDPDMVTEEVSEEELAEVVDGEYDMSDSVETDSAMFKIVSCQLIAKGMSYTAVIALSGTSYTKLYVGTAEKAETASNVYNYFIDGAGRYAFKIPVPVLDEPFALAAFSTKSSRWFDRSVTISSSLLPKDKIVPEQEINDGEYDLGTNEETGTANGVETGTSMFKVVSCKIKSAGNKYVAEIALSGTSYTKLAMGTAENAANATAYDYTVNAEGKYCFTIPVPAFDAPIAVAAYSTKSGNWFDRTITISSSALPAEAFKKETPAPTATPKPTPSPTADNQGSTSGIDNTTSLADGTYTPDSFSWSGGTGKLKGISCSKITVRGGRSYATLVIHSGNYTYVKAAGSTYYCSRGGSTSTVEIPVKLNANNHILGCTVAMSIPHEVDYTIYVGLRAALNANSDEEEGAEEILSMSFVEDTDFATDLLNVYHNADGVDLFRIADGNDCIYVVVADSIDDMPAGIANDAAVVIRPVEHPYVAVESALELLTENGIETITDAGEPEELAFSALVMAGCDFAAMPYTALTDEYRSYFETLGIPVLPDRSAEEATEEAAAEWLECYRRIFGIADNEEA